MTDSNDDKPVSFAQKDSTSAGAKAGRSEVAGGKVEMARPTTAVALAAVLVLSGLAAIVAALLVSGHKAHIVRSLTNTNPPVTAAQASAAGQKVSAAVTTALSGKTVSAGLVTRAGDAAANALGGKGSKDVLPSKSITDADRTTEQNKLRDAVKAQLKGLSGALSATQVSTVAASLSATTERNLFGAPGSTQPAAKSLHSTQVANIDKTADRAPRQLLVASIVLTVALAFVGFGIYAGRYWGRWAVLVIWILATYTQTPAGVFSLISVKSDLWPVGYRAGAAISAGLLVVALVLAYLRPTRAWFQAHRPVLPEGMPARRGLFGPRVPPPTGGRQGGAAAANRRPAITREQPATHAKSRGERTEQEKAAAAAGRTRPRQASKSRRSDV